MIAFGKLRVMEVVNSDDVLETINFITDVSRFSLIPTDQNETSDRGFRGLKRCFAQKDTDLPAFL